MKQFKDFNIKPTSRSFTGDKIRIDKILNKPADREEAISMLKSLAGRKHIVITAVCICCKSKTNVFDISTEVTFRSLQLKEIEGYVGVLDVLKIDDSPDHLAARGPIQL